MSMPGITVIATPSEVAILQPSEWLNSHLIRGHKIVSLPAMAGWRRIRLHEPTSRNLLSEPLGSPLHSTSGQASSLGAGAPQRPTPGNTIPYTLVLHYHHPSR